MKQTELQLVRETLTADETKNLFLLMNKNLKLKTKASFHEENLVVHFEYLQNNDFIKYVQVTFKNLTEFKKFEIYYKGYKYE